MTTETRDWLLSISGSLTESIQGDSFWESYLNPVTSNLPIPYAVHLAILVEPYLHLMLEGRKTVESRFSAHRIAPYQQVQKGDVILLKRSSGPIVGLCAVADAWFYRLDPTSWSAIREEFTQALCAQDPAFWQERGRASFATLIRVEHTRSLTPFALDKKDRRGWVILLRRRQALGLFATDEIQTDVTIRPDPTSGLIQERRGRGGSRRLL